jgi:hypothetical protein
MSIFSRLGAGWPRLAACVCTVVAALAMAAGPATATVDPLPGGAAPSGIFLDTGATPVLDWSVPGRFAASWAAWNPVTATYNPDFVNPRSWSVNLDGCASTSIRRITGYTFTLAQLGTTWTKTFDGTACQLRLHNMLPAQGYYRATLTLHTAIGASPGVSVLASRILQIHDYLIVSMGDSLASGEGNPDVPGLYRVSTSLTGKAESATAIRTVQWQDRRCHRSAKSGPSLAAEAAENRYASVTFLSFACSGAQIRNLISARYGGSEPIGTSTVPPQVDAVSALVGPGSPRGGRPIDALLISIGVNDLYFSSIIERCASNPNIGDDLDCVNGHGIAGNLAGLPSQYGKLAAALRAKLPATREVYLNDYPSDVFRGGACGELGRDGFGINGAEAAEMNLWGGRLSQTITAAAVAHRSDSDRWNVIGDLADPFESHAYCDKDSWFTTYEQSWRTQGNEKGTAHPNAAGAIEYAKLLRQAMVLDQVAQPYRRLTITIKAVRVGGPSIVTEFPVDMTLFQDQNGDASLTRRMYVPQNGQWTTVPPALGVFTLDVFPAPSSPRHAIALRMELADMFGIHYALGDGYGIGDHILTQPTGHVTLSYSVAAQTPAPGPGQIAAAK